MRMDQVKRLPPTVSCVLHQLPRLSLSACASDRAIADEQKLSWRKIKKTFSSWVMYVFTVAYA